MTDYLIQGPTKLTGEVRIQGSKNSAMKHVIIPLIKNGVYIIANIPNISSITSLLAIVEYLGGEVNWDGNSVTIDTSLVNSPKVIPADLFYHTSGGIQLIPILVNRFGYCEVENGNRDDTGGDNIGRSMKLVEESFEKFGISIKRSKTKVLYKLVSKDSFDFTVPSRLFGPSMLAVFSALGKNGVSKIRNPHLGPEFENILDYLMFLGIKIKRSKSLLLVSGSIIPNKKVFNNIFDRHDFITFLSAALCTGSELVVNEVNHNYLKLDSLKLFLKQSKVKIKFYKSKDKCIVHHNDISKLSPINLVASDFPNFVTEWQVLLSPLFALIRGRSFITDGIFKNRMNHWKELSKMGANFKFAKTSSFKERDDKYRSIEVYGPTSFHPAVVNSLDLRTGAALLIAGLLCTGQTRLKDPNDNIKRGYENLVGRMIQLGANIRTI